MDNIVLHYLLDFLLSAIPAVGFAMLFATPKKYLLLVALGGSITHLLRTILLEVCNLHIGTATFFAVFFMSMMFIFIAPKIKVPRPVFTVASIIPIIPGKYAYATLLAAIEIHYSDAADIENITNLVRNGLNCAAIMLSMGLGIALPPLLFYRNRPVV